MLRFIWIALAGSILGSAPVAAQSETESIPVEYWYVDLIEGHRGKETGLAHIGPSTDLATLVFYYEAPASGVLKVRLTPISGRDGRAVGKPTYVTRSLRPGDGHVLLSGKLPHLGTAYIQVDAHVAVEDAQVFETSLTLSHTRSRQRAQPFAARRTRQRNRR